MHTVSRVRDLSGGEFFEFNIAEPSLLRDLGFLPKTGTGGTAPSFASTQAAQTQAEAFARAQAERDAAIAAQAATLTAQRAAERDKADREATAEQNRLAEEAALKRGRLSTLTDLIQSFVGAQAQARDTLANLQPDAFKFAAVAGGVAPFGVTPQQGFTEQLQQFAGAPVPTADPNASLPSIESAIQGLTGANVPLPPQTFGAPSGLAGGGTVPAPFNVMSARLVGENPDGTVNKTTEVMITSPQGVAILPLGKGAQEGGFFPFEPIEFDKETLLPALGTSGIFGSLGFKQFPTASTVPSAGQAITSPLSTLGTLSTLGVRPGLVRDSQTGIFSLVSPEGTRHIGTWEEARALGFNLDDAVRLAPNEIIQLGPRLSGALTTPPPVSTTQPSAFTKFSAPIIEPTTRTLLPAPFTVARQMNKLRLTSPFAFNLLLSAYEAAGVPATAVLGSVQAALPFGQERTLTGLN
jgi:hypothetical protein